jgi:hypothetical protein
MTKRKTTAAGLSKNSEGDGKPSLSQAVRESAIGLLLCKERVHLTRKIHTPIEMPTPRRVRARGLQQINHWSCRPGPLTRRSGCEICGLTVEYALRDLKKRIGVAQWQTKLVESLPKNLKGSLPTIAEIEAEIGNAPTQLHGF